MKERSAFWYNYKGILILFVVFGHFIYSYASKSDNDFVELLYIFIYTFHMPAFVFCSGYFSKSINARSLKSACKMLLCYLFFNTAMMLFAYFYLGTGLKMLTPYYSFWYIISLVCWRGFIGYVNNTKFTIPLAFIITLLIGYWSEFTNILSLRRTIAFFLFFAMGYLMEKEKVENFISKKTTKTYVIGIVLAIIFCVVTPYIIRKFDITSKMTLMAAYKDEQEVYLRVILLLIAIVAIFILMIIVPNRKVKLLSQFGRNSLLIYLGHRFLTIIFYKELFPANTYLNSYLIYAFIATIITCIVLGSDKLAEKFNGMINVMAGEIIDSESKRGSNYKVLIIIGIIISLLLRPMFG